MIFFRAVSDPGDIQTPVPAVTFLGGDISTNEPPKKL
jgi:hypothetical protein